MTWDAVGAIGEIVGAAAVVATLVYLAVQVRHNTNALTSSTFQGISSALAQNMEVLSTTPGVPALFLKAQDGLQALDPEERAQFSFLCLMAQRRIESVFVQESLGAVPPNLAEGFKRSVLSAFNNGGYREWWETGKQAFSTEYVDWVDRELEKNGAGPVNLSLVGLETENTHQQQIP